MLKKLLSKNVKITSKSFSGGAPVTKVGIVTDVDDNFVELDNEMYIAIRYIAYIETK